MSEGKVYKVPGTWKKRAYFNAEGYHETYHQSVKNPDKFWGKHGKRIDWFTPLYEGEEHLLCLARCLDQMVRGRCHQRCLSIASTATSQKRGDQTAIIWEGDDPYDDRQITYRELHEHVCRLANVLKKHGVKKGDRVTIYMPMIPEAAYAMLACARIGAIHSVVFGGFSPEALAGRIEDCDSKFVITADEGVRGGRQGAAEGQCRRGAASERRHRGQSRWSSGAPARKSPWSAAPRSLVSRRDAAQASPECPAEKMNGRGSAVHPLHLGIDRQAQGRRCTPLAAISSMRR